MTANIMFVLDDGISMFSDGAAYDEEGIVRRVHAKQIVRPDIDTVITTSASGLSLSMLNHVMAADGPTGFDQVVDAMPGWTVEVLASMDRIHGGKNYAMFLYGGWSEREQRWRGYLIATYDLPAYGVAAFEATMLHSFAKPNASPEALEAAGLPRDLAEANEPASILGAKLMLALRQTRQEMHGPGTARGYVVGGFIQHTHLQRGRVDSRVVYRWPDEIGRVIDPSRDSPVEVAVPEQAEAAA